MVSQVVMSLANEWHNIAVYLPGSDRHRKAGLGPNEALVRAWKRREARW